MNIPNPMDEAIPSQQLTVLRNMINQHVSRIVRYAWWPPQDDCSTYHVSPHDVFSLTDGPIALYMNNGAIVGFGAQSGLASVTVWQEPPGASRDRFAADPDLYPIEASDERYSSWFCRGLVGKRIIRVLLLKRLSKSVLLACCPCEVGVGIEFECQQELLIGYGLRNDIDELVAISRNQLHPDVKQEFEEIAIGSTHPMSEQRCQE